MKTIQYYISKLLSYCQQENFAGYDPYDALNSRLFQRTPLYKSRIFRLGVIQTIKRLPVNIRPFLLIPKTQNPKALALFLKGFIKFRKAEFLKNDDLINLMIHRLITIRPATTSSQWNLRSNSEAYSTGPTNSPDRELSTGNRQPSAFHLLPSTSNLPPSTVAAGAPALGDYYYWGYSFPWQTRTILVPRAYPNLVCTVFVADALLDVYDYNGDTDCLKMAKGAAQYILNELYWEENGISGFSYPLPGLKNRVHNANFLAAALLCRVYALTGDAKFLAPALRAARYSASRQNPDGSWYYGEHSTQEWIDNFHTGFNLCALKVIKESLNTTEFDDSIVRGFRFYRNNFFDGNGIAKYYHDRTYPIDTHSTAQSIITLLDMRDLGENNIQLAASILQWALNNMWDERGYLYYQAQPHYKVKIPYMRWSQAWMFLALAKLLGHTTLERDGQF